MLSLTEVQELHELIGAAVEAGDTSGLVRARELAALAVSDAEASTHVLLVTSPKDESYDVPAVFGPFGSVEAAQQFAEEFRTENGVPSEATGENNEEWTDAGWWFAIVETSTGIENWGFNV